MSVKITPAEVDAYLKESNRKRPWLADLLGVTKSTVGHWLNGSWEIPDPEEKLLRLLIRGEYPFQDYAPLQKHVLQFSSAEIRVMNILRTRGGFATIEEWIVAKIRDYLAVYTAETGCYSPPLAALPHAADDTADYKPKRKQTGA